MKLYTVEYKANDWTSDIRKVQVVAANVIRAAQEVGKRKYTQYCGYVVSVQENSSSVVVAK